MKYNIRHLLQSGFSIIELPIIQTKEKEKSGRGKEGREAGTVIEPLIKYSIASNGTGCLRRNTDNCEKCLNYECDYNMDIEKKLLKQRGISYYGKDSNNNA